MRLVMLLQLLLLQPLRVSATEDGGVALITRVDSLRLPVPRNQRLHRHQRGHGAASHGPTEGATIETQVAAILAKVPNMWSTTWRPDVFEATRKSMAVRKSVYKSVGSAIDAYLDQRLQSHGLLNYPTARKAVRAVAGYLKDAILILLYLGSGPLDSPVSQRHTPAPHPTIYEEPMGLVADGEERKQYQQLQQLLLPPLDPWISSKVADTKYSRGGSPAELHARHPMPSWATAAWRGAVLKLQQLIPKEPAAAYAMLGQQDNK